MVLKLKYWIINTYLHENYVFWHNPFRVKNYTKIKPYAEIHSFDKLLSYFTSEPIIDNG